MEASYGQNFAAEPLSATKAKFSVSNGEDGILFMTPTNSIVDACLSATLDVADATLLMFGACQRYIRLSIPQMQDGGNYGVSVQLAVIKQLDDAAEQLTKGMDEISKYSSSRADAVEKCKLPSQTKIETSSSSKSESKVQGDEPKSASEEKSGTETKTSSTTPSPHSAELQLRMDAVVAVDVQYYHKCKLLMQKCALEYASALDFMEKNASKIDAPRGSNDGGTSAFSSMY